MDEGVYISGKDVVKESVSGSIVSHSFATPWTVVRRAPLSMEFSKQEYWSELPLPAPGDLSNPGIKSRSPALHIDFLRSEPSGKDVVLILIIIEVTVMVMIMLLP